MLTQGGGASQGCTNKPFLKVTINVCILGTADPVRQILILLNVLIDSVILYGTGVMVAWYTSYRYIFVFYVHICIAQV